MLVLPFKENVKSTYNKGLITYLGYFESNAETTHNFCSSALHCRKTDGRRRAGHILFYIIIIAGRRTWTRTRTARTWTCGRTRTSGQRH